MMQAHGRIRCGAFPSRAQARPRTRILWQRTPEGGSGQEALNLAGPLSHVIDHLRPDREGPLSATPPKTHPQHRPQLGGTRPSGNPSRSAEIGLSKDTDAEGDAHLRASRPRWLTLWAVSRNAALVMCTWTLAVMTPPTEKHSGAMYRGEPPLSSPSAREQGWPCRGRLWQR